ncbi:MAG: glycosyltransferase family 2 protein [Thermoplasmata archaeon]|nr:glycosyltransferase family 2 protein [Thermoplasmata archaeon]
MGTVCVEIAVRDDPHLEAALRSLSSQTRKPDRILLAASTDSPPDFLRAAQHAAPGIVVQVARFRGGVVSARAGAQLLIREEFTAFLDSDEIAPPDWLGLLIAPLEGGMADFSGGPTKSARPPVTSVERYMELLERSIYGDLVPAQVTYLPLQNTAWRTEPLARLGFDPRIPFAEDHDVETRAVRAGLRGVFVPEAWTWHDPGPSVGLGRWARKRYRYLVAMAMSLLKNEELGRRLGERRAPVRHPLRFLEGAMKPVALVDARLRWNRAKRSDPVIPSPEPEPSTG